MLTCGELPAWLTVTNLLLEYMLGVAAIARGFSQYVSRIAYPGDPALNDTLLGSGNTDWIAFGLVLVLTLIAALGVRESSFLVMVLVVIHLGLLLAIIIAEFTQAEAANMTPFLWGGADNLFAAAALLIFAFAGFDVIATAAEEACQPELIPGAMVGTACLATLIYVLMSLGLALMVPFESFAATYGSEFQSAAYSTAFLKGANLKGMYYVVCVTALLGILTACLVGLYGCARIVMVAARDWLLPPFLATINPRTQTPLVAQLLIGVVVAILALLVTFDTLSDLVSLGTVLVMWMVGNALLFRRYFPGLPRLRYSRWGTVESAEGRTSMPFKVPGARLSLKARQWLVVGHLVIINLVCLGLTIYFQGHTQQLRNQHSSRAQGTLDTGDGADEGGDFNHWEGELALGLLWFLFTLSFQVCCPLEYEPPKWHIPWWAMPWLPSLAILLLLFTIGSLQNRNNYAIFAYWLAGSLGFYVLFSLPMGYLKHSQLDYVNTEQMNVVELAYQDGKWQAPRPAFSGPLGGMSSRVQLGTSAGARSRPPSRGISSLPSQPQPSAVASMLTTPTGSALDSYASSKPSQVAQRALGGNGSIELVEKRGAGAGELVNGGKANGAKARTSEDVEVGSGVGGPASEAGESVQSRSSAAVLPPTPPRQGSPPRQDIHSAEGTAGLGSVDSMQSRSSRGPGRPSTPPLPRSRFGPSGDLAGPPPGAESAGGQERS
ncbi:hypothetical protein N2152v2_009172 [Parachlorella kessleri]